MHRVKVLPIKFGKLIRFKCTCGHCEDQKDDKPRPLGKGREVLVLEGFEELGWSRQSVAVRSAPTGMVELSGFLLLEIGYKQESREMEAARVNFAPHAWNSHRWDGAVQLSV